MGTCVLPRDLLTSPFILCRGSHCAATQLRVILLRELSFEVLSSTWVDFLGVNSCVPVTRHSLWGAHLPCSRTMHVVLPWSWPSHGSYVSQGLPAVAWVLHESGCPLPVLELMAFKPPFSSPHYCSVWSRLESSLAMSSLGDDSLGRRLSWATPFLGDASLGRRLSEATTRAVNLLTSLPRVPWGVPPYVDSDFWSMPRDGTVQVT